MTFEETKSNIEAVVITPLLAFRGKAAPLNQIHNDTMHDFANVMSGLLTGSDGETEFQGPGSMALANLIGSYLTTEQSITGSGTDFIGHLLEASQEGEKIAHQLQQELNNIAAEHDHTVDSASGIALGLDTGAAAQGGLDVPWDVVAIGASLVAAGLAATYNPDQAKVQKAEMAKYIAITEWSGKIEGIAAQPLPQLTPSPSRPNGDTSDFQKMIGLGGLAASLTYEPNPKHGPVQRGNVGAEPKNGQAALDDSVQVKPTSTRRVGVDPDTGEIVVFDETYPDQGIFHGHVRSWNELTSEMKNSLINAGVVDKRGRLVKKKG